MTRNDKTIRIVDRGSSGFVLFVAYIGAAIYFIQQASGFWAVILALLKAAVWPAYVLYHVLQLLHA
jgi:hypothetical protein